MTKDELIAFLCADPSPGNTEVTVYHPDCCFDASRIDSVTDADMTKAYPCITLHTSEFYWDEETGFYS